MKPWTYGHIAVTECSIAEPKQEAFARRDAQVALAERTAARETERRRQQQTDAAFVRRLISEVTPDYPGNGATETANARQVGVAEVEPPDENSTSDNHEDYQDNDHDLGCQDGTELTRGPDGHPDGDVDHDTESMAADGGERAPYHSIEPIPNVVIHNYHPGNWFSHDAPAIRTDVSEHNGMVIVNRFY